MFMHVQIIVTRSLLMNEAHIHFIKADGSLGKRPFSIHMVKFFTICSFTDVPVS